MAGKGSLLLVIGFGVIMMYMISNLTALGTRATEHMSWYNNATASKNLASIGTNAGLARLREFPTDRGDLINSPQTIDNGPYSGGSFHVTAENQPNGLVLMRTTSRFPVSVFQTLRDTVEIYMLPIGENEYRMFGWITDTPGNAQFFYGNDVIWGPVHTNGGIHLGNIAGDDTVPIFHGMVTAGQMINPADGTRAKFLGGFQNGASSINIPDNFTELIESSQEPEGRYFSDPLDPDNPQDIFIHINGDRVNIWHSSSEVDITTAPDFTYLQEEFNGAIYATGNVRVRGTLDGRLDIGAGGDIIIVNDIKYAADPPYFTEEIGVVDGITREQQIGNGDDLLGLYSMNDIVIADKGSKNFTVHGVLLALNELRAENHNSRQLVTLDTWGSIIMHNRGQIRHQNNGLIQRYRYDTRLEDSSFRPRYFPGTVTTSFQIISWYESIQLPPL